MAALGPHIIWRYATRYRQKLVNKGYSFLLTRKVNQLSADAGIFVEGGPLRVRIEKGQDARINLRGKLIIRPWLEGRDPVLISCAPGSTLTIDGDFEIGGGTRLVLSPGAELHIGGRREESASGITERSTIMVNRKVSIGVDFLCACNVFITDCDWHEIVGQEHQLDTIIGDHVWIASGASVLKGSRMGDGSILACGSVAHKITIPSHALAGGVPCRVLAARRTWRRDMPASLDSAMGHRRCTRVK